MRKFIFGFILGGAVGGLGGYFLTKRYLEGKYKSKYEEEAVKARNYYMDYFSPKKVAVVKEDPEEIVKRYSEEEKEKIKYEEIAKEYARTYVGVDPAELEGPSEDDISEEDYAEEMSNTEKRHMVEGVSAAVYDERNRRRAPERIRPEEFGQAPGYESKEYTYYTLDRTFCDEYEELIDDEVALFGADIFDWTNYEDDEDFIYIRNYMLGCDYKIEKLHCHCPQNPNV